MKKTTETVTKADMVTLIANRTGVRKYDVERCLDAFIAITIAELSKNHDVRLTGFGLFHNVPFKARRVNANISGDPEEGIYVDSKVIPRFKASPGMKEKVNKKVGVLLKNKNEEKNY